MRLYLIITIFIAYFICQSVGRSIKGSKCPKIDHSSQFNDFLFPKKVNWKIYAFSDPGIRTRSLFTVYQTRINIKTCLKYYSNPGQINLHCLDNGAKFVLDATKIYLNESRQESLNVMFYGKTKPLSAISILDTDRETFITFYGCEEIDGFATEGILVLVQESHYENFNESKLEASFDRLKPSFGYKIVKEVEGDFKDKKCVCELLYNEFFNDGKKGTREVYWEKHVGNRSTSSYKVTTTGISMKRLGTIPTFTCISVIGLIILALVIWVLIGQISSAEM